MSAWWPVTLRGTAPRGDVVTLRPLRRRDRRDWEALRAANVDWLQRWESTLPEPGDARLRYARMVRLFDQEGRAGRMLPLVIEVDGRLVGQMHLFGVVWGSLRSGSAGYWIDRSTAGRGVTPFALALLGDHVMRERGLHRLEVNIRPENAASLRVVDKLGFRDEGVRTQYLHIDGAWHDHRTFALTTEDLAGERLTDRLNRLSHQLLWRHAEHGPPEQPNTA